MSLKSRVEIDHLFKFGQRLSGSSFTLLWENSESFKYGVFVSRRFGSAVRRNRLKRLYREAIRLNRPSLKKPVIIAVLPQKSAQETGFDRLNAEISRIFGLLSPEA